MQRLRADATRIACQFGLRYRALESERPGVNGHYGLCTSDGVIRIRLRHATTDRPLKYSSLVNTLCHELAHLKHFNHGPLFRAFNEKLLDWARLEDIYQPTRRGAGPAPAAAGRAVANADARVSAKPRSKPARKSAATAQGPSQLELFG